MKPGRLLFGTIVLAPLLLILAGWVLLLLGRQGGLEPFRVPTDGSRTPSTAAAVLARGEYLARLGNCAGCHTAAQGAAFAGGRAFDTPYGRIYSSNLTPDPLHGIGAWSNAEFRHAMRHGISRNGVQSPVFPYASFAQMDDADIDALFAWLAAVAPVAQTAPADQLEFPANLPGAMTAWRLLYYRPARLPHAATAELARGQALVDGIGHCAVCHASRGSFSALAAGPALGGGRVTGWYAPALDTHSLRHFAAGDLARYLRGEVVQGRGAYGRMADVIGANLQYLETTDAAAIEAYLRTLPPPAPSRRADATLRVAATVQDIADGDRLYTQHCAGCHGDDGRGKEGHYPALTDSSAITGPDPANLIKLIEFGAVAPVTAVHRQPYTMPPFAQALSAAQTASLVNALRQRWGNPQRPVTADDVDAWGGIELH
jgi:mono/diheme cytochrome c family protein